MSREHAPFVVQRQGEFDVVEITERSLVNRAEMDAVAAGVDALIAKRSPPRIVIDFGQVTHVSSNFLGKLMAFHKKITARGGELSVANVNPRIREVFTVTKLDTQIKIRETVRAAVGGSALGGGRGGAKMWLTIGGVVLALVIVAGVGYLLTRT